MQRALERRGRLWSPRMDRHELGALADLRLLLKAFAL